MSATHIDLYKNYFSSDCKEELVFVNSWNKLKKPSVDFFLWLYVQGYSVWNSWVDIFSDSAIDFSSFNFDEDFFFDLPKYKLPTGTIDFSNSVFNGEIDLSGRIFQGIVYFKKANFHGNVNFASAIFKKNAYFSDAFFFGDENVFTQTVFDSNAVFSQANIEGSLNFNKSSFKKDASFKKCKSKNKSAQTSFRSATFHGVVNFSGSILACSADFSRSVFGSDLIFKSTNLTANLFSFASCKFSGSVFMNSMTTSSSILFKKANFSDSVSIEDASFLEKEVNMTGATFDSQVSLDNSVFNLLHLNACVFHKTASFKAVDVNSLSAVNSFFAGDLILDNSTFTNFVNFFNSNFAGFLSVSGASFLGEVCFNSSEFKKDFSGSNVFFKSIGKEVSFASCLFHGCFSLLTSRFYSKVNFSRVNFYSYVDFTKTEFLGENKQVLFKSSVFYGDAVYKDCVFHNLANFLQSVFKKELDFSGVKFLSKTKDIFFQNAIFEDEVLFERSIFSGGVNFFQSMFKKDVNFDDSEFQNINKNIVFKGSSFLGGASFKNVFFSGTVQLLQASFEKDVFFTNSRFSNNTVSVNFQSTIFSGSAFFDHVNFEGEVNFYQSLFKSNVSFIESRFLSSSSKIIFKDILFLRNVNFNSSFMCGFLDFSKTLFKKEASFVRAKITNPNNLEYFKDAIFEEGVSFDSAEFAEEADFQHAKFKSNIVLDNISCKSFNFAFSDLFNTKFKLDKEKNKNIDFNFYAAKLEKVDMTFNELNMISKISFDNARLKDTDINFCHNASSSMLNSNTKINLNNVTGNSNISFNNIYFFNKNRQIYLNNSIFDSLRFIGCAFKCKNFVMHKTSVQSSFNLDAVNISSDMLCFESIDLRYCCFNGILDISENVLSDLSEVIDLRDTKISNVPFFEKLSYDRYQGLIFFFRNYINRYFNKYSSLLHSPKLNSSHKSLRIANIASFYFSFLVVYWIPLMLYFGFTAIAKLLDLSKNRIYSFFHSSLTFASIINLFKVTLSSISLCLLIKFLLFWYHTYGIFLIDFENIFKVINIIFIHLINQFSLSFQAESQLLQELIFSSLFTVNPSALTKILVVYFLCISLGYFLISYIVFLLKPHSFSRVFDHSKLCRLKSLAYKNQEHELALKFTAHEHNAKRFVHFGFLPALLDYFIGIFCDYGRSILRPIICLIAITCLFYGYYDNLFKKNRFFYDNSSYEVPLLIGNIFSSLTGNYRNNIRQDFYESVDANKSEYGCFLELSNSEENCLISNSKLQLDILFGLQTLLSLFCIFMIGLGLRNRYKI